MTVIERFDRHLNSVCMDQISRGTYLEKGEIGRVGEEREFPLYSVIINNTPEAKKTVCFLAGVHGDETSGPDAIAQFIALLKPEKYADIKIILIPFVNPSGLNSWERKNYLGLDLNKRFMGDLPDENRIVLEALAGEDIFFFHALHQDNDQDRFYMYAFGSREYTIYQSIIRLAKERGGIISDGDVEGDPVTDGAVMNIEDKSIEYRMFTENVPFSICTEVPGQRDFGYRVNLNIAIMNEILDFVKGQVE